MVNPARTSASRRLVVLASALIVVFGSAHALTAQAPAKKVLTVDDYTRWRNITSSEISGDGNWVAYGRRALEHAAGRVEAGAASLEARDESGRRDCQRDGRRVLRRLEVVRVSDRSRGWTRRPRRARTAAAGGGATPAPHRPAVSDTGTAPAGGQGAQAGRGARGHAADAARRVELRNLATGAIQSWQDIQSFTFSANSTHLVLRRRPANAGGGGPAGDAGGADTGGAPGGGGAARARRAREAAPAGPARRRRHRPQPRHRPRSAARQRRRHRVQQDRRSARLHRGRGGEGRQRPVRARPRERPRSTRSTTTRRTTTASPGAKTARRSRCSRAATSTRCASATTCSSRSPTCRPRSAMPEPAPVMLDPAKAAGFPPRAGSSAIARRSTGATTTSACSSA